MADEPGEVVQTLVQKILFYITAFFVLLAIFSLFAFLFLVPFVIDPAFTTIFMQFDSTPTVCVTVETESRVGTKNCTWTSCREGCTKELFECTHIRVNYKLKLESEEETGEEGNGGEDEEGESERNKNRVQRAVEEPEEQINRVERAVEEPEEPENVDRLYVSDIYNFNDSTWFVGAKLYPNVKGCGYPPILVCSDFFSLYQELNSNFSCYYSKIDPNMVITDYDLNHVYMDLVYAMAIPIPSFIVSVIYLTIAYFKIYNEDDVPVDTIVPGDLADSLSKDEEGNIKVTETDDTKEQDALPHSNSNNTGDGTCPSSNTDAYLQPGFLPEKSDKEILPPIQYEMKNLTKSMTTSIPTLPGPIAEV